MPADVQAPGTLAHGDQGVSGCLECGWRGVPTIIDGKRQHICPACGDSNDLPDSKRKGRKKAQHAPRPHTTVRRDEPKLGRNDPCHCGSGKKFKKCHG